MLWSLCANLHPSEGHRLLDHPVGMNSLALFFIGPRLPCFGSPASTLTSDPEGEAAAPPAGPVVPHFEFLRRVRTIARNPSGRKVHPRIALTRSR